MPTHVLARGSELIQAILSLGEALGYVAKPEFDIEQDRANPPAVDVAWLREKGQRFPLMIFEIESQATNSAANNPVKVFGQSIEQFEKPLFFFHVFVRAGDESTRIDNLRRLFGTHNYRVYRLDRDGIEPLLRDVLSQHRRLQRTLPIGSLLDELARAPWNEVPIRTITEHAEALRFEAPFLNEYARRARADLRFRTEHLRLLRVWLEPPTAEKPTSGYETFIGGTWSAPIHLGLLAVADTSGGDWLKRLRDWQEHSSYMSQIGPHLGLSRDYDDFVLGLSPVLWALTAALMYKVKGAATYILSQVIEVLNHLERAHPEASFFTALWALHLASAAGDGEQYTLAQKFINERGGVSPDVLYEPPSMVAITEPDEEWATSIWAERENVPDMAEFRRQLPPHYSRTADLEADLFRLAYDVLVDDSCFYEWSAPVALLLHTSYGRMPTRSAV